MKKSSYILISIIIIFFILGGCVFAYLYFTSDNNENNNILEEKALYTADNFPKIDASSATQPLAIAIANNFTQTTIDESKLNFTKTHFAYVKLINNEVDLILVTEPSEDELKLAREKGIELEVIPVVREGFVFFVNSKNKVSSLSLEQVQNIYTGDIKNWSEVGGDNIDITPYQRPVNSGSQTGMLSLVMKDKKLMKPITENIAVTMSDIVNLVSIYNNNDKSAIGYSYYYYATTMYQNIDKEVAKNIKFLKINGVEPNADTIKAGTYPLTTSYYIVINKNADENSKARKLANEILGKRGKRVAKEAGYVPVE